ncbi:DUF3558 domain-containing protein [Streptomyces sp. SHP 1-2]|uniref:DUF3558 domain-containing protein n=1 Tax=Streptomyces sp. SHP 1-2 TaxID=2769489 RepID=UPI002238807B|nr:DUF3558 domain-containing protein [Streptomyces sp. SHP 1-2]MCW5253032.1 DUF3558 domain-containing protein [Streptomyces sp. SHP 1-2]
MQRKAYVPAAACLVALLAGCTGGTGDGATTDDSHPGGDGVATEAAQPGRYRTLPEPCRAVGRKTLDAMLPGIQEIPDEAQRQKAYAGEPSLAYNTDRKVGCRWKVDSADATDHLFVDFERVVSYDNAVSDDSQAEALFARQVAAADLPEPSASPGASAPASPTGTPSPTASATASPSGSPAVPSGDPSTDATASPAPLPRLLDDLGDEAFVDDELSGPGPTAERRTVTVAFRTSNVVVTIEYAEQPALAGVVPDSEDMQDRARKLASQLAGSLRG